MTEFIKMHGTGNNFIVFDCFKNNIKLTPEKIKFICSLNFGIGSDGVLLIVPPKEKTYDGEMVMYNTDGSLAEMCGNGLRCAAKFIADYYEVKKNYLKLLTGDGIKTAEIFRVNNLTETVKINMGKPIFEGVKIPSVFDKESVLNEKIFVDEREYKFSLVSMGNPHCIIYVEDIDSFDLKTIGPKIENHQFFPNRINVSVVQILSKDKLKQRIWERGSEETFACGTGACAVTVISRVLGLTNEKITINVKGGILECEYTEKGDVSLKGNSVEIFRGTINI
eukprot:gene11576-4822_t